MTMINRRFFSAAALILPMALSAAAALAGDEGLYEDVFDPQSSFVRVLAPGQPFAAVDGRRLSEFTAGLSSYVNVMPGTISLAYSGGTLDMAIMPSSHYTVVVMGGAAPVILTDDLKLNPARSDVSLYNLTSEAVDLYVPAARAVALKAVPPMQARSVALKAPLTLDFVSQSGGADIAMTPAVELKRRGGVSIVLTDSGAGHSAVAVANSYAR